MCSVDTIELRFSLVNGRQDIDVYVHEVLGWVISVDPAHLMQFTGLKDIHGREIYEGDITKHGVVCWFNDLNWDSGGSKHPGFYFDLEYWYDHELDWSTGFDDIEVLGNIYENPELLTNNT